MTKEQLIGYYNYKEGKIEFEDTIIYLTKTDNVIFKLLLDNYNKIVKVETISKKIYKEEVNELYNLAIRTAISRLRKKVKKIVDIDCRHGFGYKLEMKRENKWKR